MAGRLEGKIALITGNHDRLLEPIGSVPPAEYEAAYYCDQSAPAALVTLT